MEMEPRLYRLLTYILLTTGIACPRGHSSDLRRRHASQVARQHGGDGLGSGEGGGGAIEGFDERLERDGRADVE